MSFIETVFPVIGVVLSNALYFAPASGVAAVVRSGLLGNFNPLPQAIMVLSTIAWAMYGLSVPNAYLFAANAPGVLASIIYYVSTLPLIPWEAHAQRWNVQAIVVGGVAFELALWGGIIFSGCTAETRSYYLGLYGSALCVILFASPLSTAALVLATGDSTSIYAPLTLAQCVNCGTWTVYGFAIGDVWVWGPNLVGTLLGLVQVGLKTAFPSRGKQAADPAAKHLFRNEGFVPVRPHLSDNDEI
mmetsp:Transcript_46981/g.156593  ORF Transcript_46981/g.156593 Transcript_46981/m.156593 type:complete len:245 (+) Transcript_46981:84-818(+)